MRPQGDDFMQGAPRQPIGQGSVETAGRPLREMDGASLLPLRPGWPMAHSRSAIRLRHFEEGDPRAQKIHPFRLAGYHRLAS